MVRLGATPATVEVRVAPSARDAGAAVAAGKAHPERLVLALDDLRYEANPGRYEVYLNLPAGAAPDPRSAYYAGSVAVYGPAYGDAGGTQSTAFDVTATVRALAAHGDWDPERVRVTFTPSGAEPAGGTFAAAAPPALEIGRVSIVSE